MSIREWLKGADQRAKRPVTIDSPEAILSRWSLSELDSMHQTIGLGYEWSQSDRRRVLLEASLRPKGGDCPTCGADAIEWCREGCWRIDPMDYR